MKVTVTKFSALKRAVEVNRRQIKWFRKRIVDLNSKVYALQYYLDHRGRYRDRKILTEMKRVRQELESSLKPFRARKVKNNQQRYVMMTTNQCLKLERILERFC